jgi:hypothetical protein
MGKKNKTQQSTAPTQSFGTETVEVPFDTKTFGSQFLPPAPSGKVWEHRMDQQWNDERGHGYTKWDLVNDPNAQTSSKAAEPVAVQPLTQNNPDWASIFGGFGNGSVTGSSFDPIRSSVDVPDIQDWGVDQKIADLKAAAAAEEARKRAEFEDVLQATGNMNASPAITFSPSNAVSNPSSWENILNTTWNA